MYEQLNSAENTGFKIMGHPRLNDQPVSIIVVGLSRGGTSAVASSIDALGISLGEKYHKPIFEDIYLSEAFRRKKWRQLQKIISNYEDQFGVFAWKLPDSHKQLFRIDRLFKNPGYIFVYRDIFAVSDRRNEALDTDYFVSMQSCLTAYSNIVKFIKKSKPYALHVSYEKLIQNQKQYAEHLALFCGRQAIPEKINLVVERISPSPSDYTKWASNVKKRKELRKRGLSGRLAAISDNTISGWAIDSNDTEPLELDIYINDVLIGTCIANQYRKDLLERNKSDDGIAGFRYRLNDKTVKSGDVISVKVHNTSLHLANSPRQVE